MLRPLAAILALSLLAACGHTEIARDGALLVADDVGNTVWR